MNSRTKLGMLSSSMEYETAEDIGCPKMKISRMDDIYITHAHLPNGSTIPLLKTLLTSVCERDCNYCPFRTGRDFRRATLTPDEMAKVFFSLYQSGIVKGLFLSSGLAGGGIRVQDKLIDTVEILRNKYQFGGYIHLKIMPGAQYEQVHRAMQLSDRISINLEAPNQHRLHFLAPHKEFDDELIQVIRWILHIRQNKSSLKVWNKRWPSVTTQFVVGPAKESDVELISTTMRLFNFFQMKRVYYRAFTPASDTPLENYPPTKPSRELRLYQASFLIRDYDFEFEELPFEENGNLSLRTDPKTIWAMKNLSDQPLEINRASSHELLRVPGFGPKSVKRIIHARMKGTINDLSDLYRMGIKTEKAQPYILLNGKSPRKQMILF